MRRQEILKMLENLSKYKKFNSLEGIHILGETYQGKYCEKCINLKATNSHKESPFWLNKFSSFIGAPLIAIGFVSSPIRDIPFFIFEPGPKKSTVNPDYLHINDFIGADPSKIDAILGEIIKDLQNEIINDHTALNVLEVQGILLPQYIGHKALCLNFDFNNPGIPIKSGYHEIWESDTLDETLLLSQSEAIEYYLSI